MWLSDQARVATAAIVTMPTRATIPDFAIPAHEVRELEAVGVCSRGTGCFKDRTLVVKSVLGGDADLRRPARQCLGPLASTDQILCYDRLEGVSRATWQPSALMAPATKSG